MSLYNLQIKSSIRNYSLSFVDTFENPLNDNYNEGDVVIADKKVADLYFDKVKNQKWQQNLIQIEVSENQKSYLQLAPIIERLIEKGFRRNNKLIGIGGGVTQDVTAFIASIMLRGVDWMFFPTTLVAQGDSCIGSKTSINFGKYKNQLGNFYPAREIFVDVNFLKTLEERDIASGLGEMAHYFLVAGEDDFQRIKKEYPLVRKDFELLKKIIYRSLEIKKSYIEIDEFDKNERQVFNYGHSFGHAIESLTSYKVPHGVAVSIGMDIANFMSVKYGYMDSDKRNEIREFLSQIWKGYSTSDINLNNMENALRKDKKNKGKLLGLILSKGPGKTFKDFKELDNNFSAWLREYFEKELEGSK